MSIADAPFKCALDRIYLFDKLLTSAMAFLLLLFLLKYGIFCFGKFWHEINQYLCIAKNKSCLKKRYHTNLELQFQKNTDAPTEN